MAGGERAVSICGCGFAIGEFSHCFVYAIFKLFCVFYAMYEFGVCVCVIELLVLILVKARA